MDVVPIRQGLLRDAAVQSLGGKKQRRLKNDAAVSGGGGIRLFGGRMGP